MFCVLVVEDDEKLNQMMCAILERNGYHALGAVNAAQALNVLHSTLVDLVVSDIMMPGMDGYQLAERIRGENNDLPILFVSAKDKLEDKQKGFRLGVDDYMVKPIDINELVLRVGALLRRARIATEHRLTVGGTVLDYDTFAVSWAGRELTLPKKEFLLLFKLLSYPNKIFTRSQLMDEFWGLESESLERTVDVHVTRIRDKLKDNNDFSIETVRGLGYKAVRNDEKK